MTKDEIKTFVESETGETIINVWRLGPTVYKVEAESGKFYIVHI